MNRYTHLNCAHKTMLRASLSSPHQCTLSPTEWTLASTEVLKSLFLVINWTSVWYIHKQSIYWYLVDGFMWKLQSLQYCVCPLDGACGKVIIFNVFNYIHTLVRKQTSCFALICIKIASQQRVSWFTAFSSEVLMYCLLWLCVSA